MINGVLVERTVQDVRPALVTNSDGLKKVLDDLVKQYKRQQEDMEKWKVGVSFLSCTLHFREYPSFKRQAIGLFVFKIFGNGMTPVLSLEAWDFHAD